MTTAKRRNERQQLNPDLGVLTARLQRNLQDELFKRLAEQGHEDVHPRHSAVLAYLDEDGIRASELARLSGRDKQVVGRMLDELEEAGYVERHPDPGDRRAKLIVPTRRGLEQLQLRDEIVAEIERRHAEAAGPRVYAEFRNVLRGMVERGSRVPTAS